MTGDFFPTLPSALRKFDRYARRDGFHGGTESRFRQWRENARETLRRLLALERMEMCPLRPRVTRRERLPGMVREHLLLDTEPGVTLSAYLLIPDGADRDTPVFLCPPGHGGCGKESVAGVRDLPLVAEKIDAFRYDFGLRLASMGYVAFCPDSRGQGERREDAEDLGTLSNDCQRLAHMGLAIGVPVVGMLVWDLQRAMDYLRERDEWDTRRLVGCGFSGGGMQVLYAAALDDRLSAALVSGYFYGFRDALLCMNGNCACNYAPGVMEHFDMGDLGAMICPRPLVVQSGRLDPLSGSRGLRNVTEQLDITRGAYTACGCPERLRQDVGEEGHRFYPEHLAELTAFLLQK